jgi:glycosyltransferase involved in cell wall biosynthesis
MSSAGTCDRRLRVMTLIDSVSRVGGAERLAAEIAIRLDPDRFERHLCLTRYSPGELVERAVSSGVRLLPLERRVRFDPRVMCALAADLRRQRIDVLHSHLLGPNVWAAVIGSLARVPVRVAHEHSWSFVGEPLRRLVDRHLVTRSADLVLAVSSEDRRRMIEFEHLPPSKVQVLTPGIAAFPPASRSEARAGLNIAEGAPVVGTVCRLAPEKGLEVLVEAANLLRGEFQDLIVLVVGEGEREAKLRALIDEHRLGASVRLLGRRPAAEIPELVAAVDVGVNCSHREGTPLSILEYMAAGKPVVATRVGGTTDLIEHGVHGLLVPPGDPHALAGALRQILRNPTWRAAMGERGRARQREEFDLDVMVRRLEDLYEELFERSLTGYR